jgi:hypothetical protein
MKPTLIRLFALAMLAASIPGFAASMPVFMGTQDASGQPKDSNMTQSKDDHMMKSNDDHMMKSKDDSTMKDTKNTKKKMKKEKKQNPKQKPEDKYDPLQGIWG